MNYRKLYEELITRAIGRKQGRGDMIVLPLSTPIAYAVSGGS